MAKAAAVILLEQADRVRTLEVFIDGVRDALATQQGIGECITEEVDEILKAIPEVLGEAPRISATEVDRLSRRVDNLEYAMREAVRQLTGLLLAVASFGRKEDNKIDTTISLVRIGLEEALK